MENTCEATVLEITSEAKRGVTPGVILGATPGVIPGVIPGILEDVLGAILVKLDTLSRRNLAETSKLGVETIPRILLGIPGKRDSLGCLKSHKIARAESRRYKEIALGRIVLAEPTRDSAWAMLKRGEIFGAGQEYSKHDVAFSWYISDEEGFEKVQELAGKHNRATMILENTWCNTIYVDTVAMLRRGHQRPSSFAISVGPKSARALLRDPQLRAAVRAALTPKIFDTECFPAIFREANTPEEYRSLADAYPDAYEGHREHIIAFYEKPARLFAASYPTRLVVDGSRARPGTTLCAFIEAGAAITNIYAVADIDWLSAEEIKIIFDRMIHISRAPQTLGCAETGTPQDQRLAEFLAFAATSETILGMYKQSYPEESARLIPGEPL